MNSNETNYSKLQGQFLIATPLLANSFFEEALIYILEHNEEGSFGLIVNHPLDITENEILIQVEPQYFADHYPQHIYKGGPVEMEKGFVLHRPGLSSWENQLNLTEGLAVTTSTDILAAMASGEDIGDHLIILGYSGWSPQQLEEELADNAWITADIEPSIIFDTPPEDRLAVATRSLGFDYEQLSGFSGHA